jgi:hypothetical protein
LRSRSVYVDELVDQGVVAPAELLPHRLKPERFPVELNHPIQVPDVNRYVVYASDHGFLL